MSQRMLRLLRGLVTLFLVLHGTIQGNVARGQSVPVRDFVGQKEQWPVWAAEERRIMIEGRFQGRTADTLKFEKLEIPCRLSSSVKLPDRMRSGQRVEIQGRMVSETGRIFIQVSRAVVRDTESEQLAKLSDEQGSASADQLLALASRFEPDAEFYEDKSLAGGIAELRNRAVDLKRRQASGDLDQLRQVGELAASLKASETTTDVLKFEVLFRRWKQPHPDFAAINKDIRTANRGWDRQVPEPPDRLVTAFQRDAIAAYETGTEDDRQWLHRLLFQSVRLQDIQSQLNPDGSNGLLLAGMVRREFPTQSDVAAELEAKEIAWRLGRIPQLSRRELQELYELLIGNGQTDRGDSLLTTWLQAQSDRFNSQSIGDLLRTADEYLFAAEFARKPEFREQGILLLKQAWQSASTQSPDDARLISERLRSLGWDRRNDQWITVQQLQQMPRDEVQAAASEGRVIPGMSPEQVVRTLGQPTRITRIGSASQLRELWIYSGDIGLVVRFRRGFSGRADDRTVDDISRIPATGR